MIINKGSVYTGKDKEGKDFIGTLVSDIFMQEGGEYALLDNGTGELRQVPAYTLKEVQTA